MRKRVLVPFRGNKTSQNAISVAGSSGGSIRSYERGVGREIECPRQQNVWNSVENACPRPIVAGKISKSVKREL